MFYKGQCFVENSLHYLAGKGLCRHAREFCLNMMQHNTQITEVQQPAQSTYQVSQRCNCCWTGKDLPIEIKNLGTEWRLEKVIKDSFQGFI